ncbi:MAG: hypothetical protein IID32_11230, partial [Planctomycetes bacterium]|nr:hypothetical protein [Planctomycetota bacterium]
MSKRFKPRSVRSRRKKARSNVASELKLEHLERRLLLDVAGWWDELGYRSASGGGVSWDLSDNPGGAQLVLSGDGDPIIFWTDGILEEYVDVPISFHFQTAGAIYARQYGGEELGWWDLNSGGGDSLSAAINTVIFSDDEIQDIEDAFEARDSEDDPVNPNDFIFGGNNVNTPARQISAAAGPNGIIVVVWVADAIPLEVPSDGREGLDSEIYAKMWNGQQWLELNVSARGGGVSNDGAALNEKPDVAISDSGDVYISYTALHPLTDQREIVVKRFGFDYGLSKA